MQRERPGAVGQHPGQALERRGPGQRDQAVEREKARIAEGGCPPGLGAVEKGDAMAGALQGAGGCGADDAGANDDNGILIAHGPTLARLAR